jgi:membrane-bound ClpP family serine protease
MDPLVLAICCFALAIALALLDIFVPSGGVLVILSMISAIGSILFGFRSGNTAGMVMLTLLLAAVPGFLLLTLRMWPHTPIGRLIVLPTPGQPKRNNPRENEATEPEADPMQQLVGQIGIAQNPLMPTGHVRIQHRNYNAVAERGLIEAGQRVEVLAVRQRNLIVAVTTRQIPSSNTPPKEEQPVAGQSLLDLPADQLGLDSLDN